MNDIAKSDEEDETCQPYVTLKKCLAEGEINARKFVSISNRAVQTSVIFPPAPAVKTLTPAVKTPAPARKF